MRLGHPLGIDPVDDTGTPVAPGLYGLLVDDASGPARVVGLSPATAEGSGLTYALTGRTAIVTRDTTSSGSFAAATWFFAHDHWSRPTEFKCDIFAADTYTFYIDGRAASSGVVCGAASTNNVFTVTTPRDLGPGTHMLSIRGTAARRFYYKNVYATPTGTYTSVGWYAWLEGGIGNQVPGTLTFDAEGSL